MREVKLEERRGREGKLEDELKKNRKRRAGRGGTRRKEGRGVELEERKRKRRQRRS